MKGPDTNIQRTLIILKYLFIYETRSQYIALAGLELSMQPRLAMNSQRYFCLCLPRGSNVYMCASVMYIGVLRG